MIDFEDDYTNGEGKCTCPNQRARDEILRKLRSQGLQQVYHPPSQPMTFFAREVIDSANPSRVQYLVEYKGR